MIGTYLRSASTTDERYGVPRPMSHVPCPTSDVRKGMCGQLEERL